MFTDTHCHVYKEYYENIEEVIEEAKLASINRFILSSSDSNSCREVVDLVKKYSSFYGTLGFHPEVVDSYQEKDLDYIEKNLTNSKIVAIGEIGLDYHYTKDKKEEQKLLFENQLKLAEKYNLPVVIHSREATEDTIMLLKKYPKVKGVIHSFSGSLETAKIYISMGYKLGINGVVTFKNSHLKEILPDILNSIVLETDSPYLTPHPYRGTKNSPKFIKEIAEYICDYCNISFDDLAEITNQNIKCIFDI